MHLGDTHRYSRAAMVAVVLFLVFDSVALGLNFWLTWRIESQAIGINLAGRQRMLSQRMVKVLMQYQGAVAAAREPEAQAKELQLTFKLFDNTLRGFAQGFHTKGGSGEDLFLSPVESGEARKVVDEAVLLWAPYRIKVQAVLEAKPEGLPEALRLAVDHAQQNNLTMLDLMNQLTTALERNTQHEAAQIRYFQGAAFILALINFFGAFFLYRRRLHEAGQHRDLLDEVINKVSASVFILDINEKVLKANSRAEVLFGYPSSGMQGLSIDRFVSGREDNFVGLRLDGSSFIASVDRSEVLLDGRRLGIVTVGDITEQRVTEEHLTSLAYHDLLTRLPNRMLFDDRLHMALAIAGRRGVRVGVIFLDLDRFKPVNDTYGHDVGDALLKEVAVRLRASVRESDTVARRGGDEFTVLVTDAENEEACGKVAEVIIHALSQPYTIDGLTLDIGCSVGISVSPEDGHEAGQLLARADEAMYRAKELGRGRYCFYRQRESEPGAAHA